MASGKNRSLSGMGYTDFPASIFYNKLNFGFGTRSHLENLYILNKWWSDLDAYLPVFFERKEDQFKALNLDQRIKESLELNDQVLDLYQPSFEGLGTFNPEEKRFVHAMMVSHYSLNRITAITRVIAGQHPESEDVLV